MDFLDKIIRWFFASDNRYVRSATCLMCMVLTIVGIWWMYTVPVDTWMDILICTCIVIAIVVLQSIMWPLLEYICKHDSF